MGGLVLLSLAARPARAAQLEFTPITIDALPGAFATTLDVANHGGGSSVLQVRAFSWEQPDDGSEKLEHSDDIAVSPPMFTLPEGETQTVRVVLHTEPGTVEHAFRIFIDEIPPANATTVQMALRVSLPVFAANATARSDLHWRVQRSGAERLEVIVRNSGQRHARIGKLSLAVPGRSPVEGRLVNQLPYVLAGAERRWLVSLAAVRPGATVNLVADADGKSLALPLPVEG